MFTIIAQATLEKGALDGAALRISGGTFVDTVVSSFQERPWIWFAVALVIVLLLRRRR